jgi:hypothetical protein
MRSTAFLQWVLTGLRGGAENGFLTTLLDRRKP